MSNYNSRRDRDASGRLKRCLRRSPYRRGSPNYWVHLHVTRPRRREEERLCHLVTRGHDPVEIMWPVGSRKPHVYYS